MDRRRPHVATQCCADGHRSLLSCPHHPGQPLHRAWIAVPHALAASRCGQIPGAQPGLDDVCPNVLKDSAWYVARGTLSNGQQVDVYNNRDDVTFARPSSIAETYDNDHWFPYPGIVRQPGNGRQAGILWRIPLPPLERDARSGRSRRAGRGDRSRTRSPGVRRRSNPRLDLALVHQCDG